VQLNVAHETSMTELH